MTPNETPTAAADPKALDALFNADPEDLTDQDIDTLVATYREKRKLWLQEDAKKKAQGRKTVGTKEVPQNLSLDDIL